jgi:hypothetical protein
MRMWPKYLIINTRIFSVVRFLCHSENSRSAASAYARTCSDIRAESEDFILLQTPKISRNKM